MVIRQWSGVSVIVAVRIDWEDMMGEEYLVFGRREVYLICRWAVGRRGDGEKPLMTAAIVISCENNGFELVNLNLSVDRVFINVRLPRERS